jgi:hypothetical protein
VSPPDWVVWSPLGLNANYTPQPQQQQQQQTKEGKDSSPSSIPLSYEHAYDNYFHAITHFQSTFERAPYWQLLREPVPIVGQAGGTYRSTPPLQVQVGGKKAAEEARGDKHHGHTHPAVRSKL